MLRSTVAKNAASLYCIQFAGYIFSHITVPYLVRVLRRERFSMGAFGQGLMAYFMGLVEHGFGLSATRRISPVRKNHELVSRITSNVMASRTILHGGSFMLLSIAGPLVRGGNTGLMPGASSSGTGRMPVRRVGASGASPCRTPFGPAYVECELFR